MRAAALPALLCVLTLASGWPVLAEDAAPTPPDVLGDREFARSNYPAAENYYREALHRRPADVHVLSRLALLLTWRGQYDESVGLYLRGLRQEPANLDLKRGLATAYTWSEKYDRALGMYREMLQARPGDEGLKFEMAQAQAWSGDNAGAKATLHEMVSRNPRHVKARLLLAQVHSWSGEPAAAEKIYRSLILEDAGNVAALSGLGDALAAQEKYDEALAAYDKALSLDPKNRTALEGRARVFHSQGRAPEALDAVRQALDLYPDARDARRLGREIGGALRPSLQLFANTTQDSDDNDLATWGGVYTHYMRARGYVGLSWTHAQTGAGLSEMVNPIDPNDVTRALSTATARYDTLRATGGWHASKYFSLYAEAGPERTDLPVATDPNAPLTDDSTQHVAGSLTFELNPAGWLAVVGTASAERLVGTTQAFMNDVGIEAATLTAILRPHPSVRVRLTGQTAQFAHDADVAVASGFTIDPNTAAASDNHRDLRTAGVSWKVPLRRPRLTLHYNHRWMSYDRNLNQGYFDPDLYASNTAGFDISDTIGKRLYWGCGADRGAQAIRRDPAAPTAHNDVVNYRGLAGIRFGEGASLEAYYARSDLALQSAAGFKSTEGGIRLVIRFGGSLGPAAPDRRNGAGAGASD